MPTLSTTTVAPAICKRWPMFALLAAVVITIGGCVSGHDVEARKWNEAGQCWGPKQESGYYDGPSGCDGNAPIMRDSKGQYWQFSSGCVPDDYEQVEDADVVADMGAAPVCDG